MKSTMNAVLLAVLSVMFAPAADAVSATATDAQSVCDKGTRRFYVAYNAQKPNGFSFGYSFLCAASDSGITESGIKTLEKAISDSRQADIVIVSIIRLDK
jgi:hypothetical protein